jgi:hypothetical protein
MSFDIIVSVTLPLYGIRVSSNTHCGSAANRATAQPLRSG